ncbi:hypothetical protein BH09PSE2_BH09PSE2_09220 [soil metagenome]
MLARSALIYAPSIILPRLASFAVVLMLTHRLPAAEFGFYTLVVLIGEMLDTGSSNWIRFTMLRLDIAEPGGWRKSFRRSYVLTACAVGISGLVALAIAWPMAQSRAPAFALALLLYVMANSLSRIGLTALQMRERRAIYSLLEVSRSLVLLASAALAVQLGATSFLQVVGVTSAVTFSFGLLTVAASRHRLPSDTAEATGYLARLQYGASLIVLGVFTYAALGSDRVLLKLLSGPAAVGVYAAAYVLGRLPSDIVTAALNQGAFPELMKRHDRDGKAAARAFLETTWRLHSLLTLGTFAMLCGLNSALVTALLPAAYVPPAKTLLPIIAAASVLQNTKIGVVDNIFHVMRKNWLQLTSYGPAVIGAILTGVIAIPRLGATGAALSALVGMGAGLAGSVFLTRRMIAFRALDRELVKAVAAAVCAFTAASVAAWTARGQAPMLDLIIGFIAGAGAWGCAVLVLRPEAARGPLQAVLSRLRPPSARDATNPEDTRDAEGVAP